jgi:hypothetical protein
MMPVVINEFEIIADHPQEPAPAAASGEEQSEAKPQLRAVDIVNILERQQQRLARVFAD